MDVSVSAAFSEYAARLGISRPLTRDERQRALWDHLLECAEKVISDIGIDAALANDKEMFLAMAEHQTSTPEIAARVGEAFGRLAEDEAHV